jgi:hypothetical protein
LVVMWKKIRTVPHICQFNWKTLNLKRRKYCLWKTCLRPSLFWDMVPLDSVTGVCSSR